MPFALAFVQVDDCSEFKNEFEQTCKALKVPLQFSPSKLIQTLRLCGERQWRSAQ